jgi:ribosomal protein L37E
VDAHCAFDQGFDVKMMAAMEPDITMVPIMKNLHAFDWVCGECGARRYQGKSGTCERCGGEEVRDIVWRAKPSPNSTSYCFDSEPHFQYFKEYTKRREYKDNLPLTETMSLQGSCWMLERERYFSLNMDDDETFGNWGSQGIEVSLRSWLSGGRVLCNHNTWYAHMFRTQGGDFGFPYKLSGSQVQRAKSAARDLFFENKWPKQTRPLSWLLERFWPVRGWTDAELAAQKERERG